mmetsp:Transcript_16021/g.36602  ORF Transcript_16021/g.36602 Transcript_16021/m.36602 type:complete len:383 (-) Transcript_16021:512-1660(-)
MCRGPAEPVQRMDDSVSSDAQQCHQRFLISPTRSKVCAGRTLAVCCLRCCRAPLLQEGPEHVNSPPPHRPVGTRPSLSVRCGGETRSSYPQHELQQLVVLLVGSSVEDISQDCTVRVLGGQVQCCPAVPPLRHHCFMQTLSLDEQVEYLYVAPAACQVDRRLSSLITNISVGPVQEQELDALVVTHQGSCLQGRPSVLVYCVHQLPSCQQPLHPLDVSTRRRRRQRRLSCVHDVPDSLQHARALEDLVGELRLLLCCRFAVCCLGVEESYDVPADDDEGLLVAPVPRPSAVLELINAESSKIDSQLHCACIVLLAVEPCLFSSKVQLDYFLAVLLSLPSESLHLDLIQRRISAEGISSLGVQHLPDVLFHVPHHGHVHVLAP